MVNYLVMMASHLVARIARLV